MSTFTGVIPREGLTADVLLWLIKSTALNPIITLPLLLLSRYTHRGQALALSSGLTFDRLKPLLCCGLARWANNLLNYAVLNNWRQDEYHWDKEIVLITGGSDGIGKVVVQLLAQRGVKVAVLDVQPLTFEAPSNVHFYRCDVRSTTSIAKAAQYIRADLGHPTVLINNAGVGRGKTILDGAETDVRLTFDINTLSHYWTVKEFLPDMIANNHGMVVTIASVASYVAAPQMVDYSASKAAALSFHEGLTSELTTRYNAPKVRTVVINPGHVKTKLFAGFDQGSPMIYPSLEVETIAEAIVNKVLSGTSGQVVLPVMSNIMMLHWNGRQVEQLNK